MNSFNFPWNSHEPPMKLPFHRCASHCSPGAGSSSAWSMASSQTDRCLVTRPSAAGMTRRSKCLENQQTWGVKHLVGGLEHVLWLSIYWEFHHPNWLSYFSEGLNHQPDLYWAPKSGAVRGSADGQVRWCLPSWSFYNRRAKKRIACLGDVMSMPCQWLHEDLDFQT